WVITSLASSFGLTLLFVVAKRVLGQGVRSFSGIYEGTVKGRGGRTSQVELHLYQFIGWVGGPLKCTSNGRDYYFIARVSGNMLTARYEASNRALIDFGIMRIELDDDGAALIGEATSLANGAGAIPKGDVRLERRNQLARDSRVLAVLLIIALLVIAALLSAGA